MKTWGNHEDVSLLSPDEIAEINRRAEAYIEAVRQEGRREVVEWIKEHTNHMNTNMYGISLDGKEWQSKLKEWGIE